MSDNDMVPVELPARHWAVILASLNAMLRNLPFAAAMVRPVKDDLLEELGLEPEDVP